MVHEPPENLLGYSNFKLTKALLVPSKFYFSPNQLVPYMGSNYSFYLYCICNSVSLENVNITNDDIFWETFGSMLSVRAPKRIVLDSINSDQDFRRMFKKDKWEYPVVL